MMRCPPFAFRSPTSLAEAARILHEEGPDAAILAGGTDLLPSMKRRTVTPRVIVSLRRVVGLRSMQSEGSALRLGAATTIAQIASDISLAPFAAIRRAAGQLASPHIRNTATLGGNLCLDTRCNYYDQDYDWRQAIGFCKKKDGVTCWVAPGSSRCWAVSSTDLAPPLIALGAEVTLVSCDGERRVALSSLYADDGVAYLTKRPDEILSNLHLPDPAGLRSTYYKLRRRQSFDFPVLGLAAALKVDDGGLVTSARLVFGAVASRPVVIDAAASLVGHRLSDPVIEAFADEASKVAKPMDNTDYGVSWRKRIARSFVVSALRELRGDDPRSLGLLAIRSAGLTASM